MYLCLAIQLPWEDTAYYIHARSRVTSGGEFRFFSSVTDVDRFFDSLDALYERIREDGYKTQQQLRSERKSDGGESSGLETDPLNEISVNLARDGTFLWQVHGQHRLIMAKLLHLDLVPVQVCTRHAEWQRIRNQITPLDPREESAAIPDRYRTHPDLQGLLN